MLKYSTMEVHNFIKHTDELDNYLPTGNIIKDKVIHMIILNFRMLVTQAKKLTS